MSSVTPGSVGGCVTVETTKIAGTAQVVLRLSGTPRPNEILLDIEDAQDLAESLYGQAVALVVDARRGTGEP